MQHTQNDTLGAFWRVDLGGTYLLDNILLPSGDNYLHMAEVEVFGDNPSGVREPATFALTGGVLAAAAFIRRKVA